MMGNGEGCEGMRKVKRKRGIKGTTEGTGKESRRER